MIITRILLIILFFSLPLIHGGIFATLGFDFKLLVSGNFEFTKSIFFNILSGIIVLSFFIEKVFSPHAIPLSNFPLKGERASRSFLQFHFSWQEKIVGGILLILLFSTIFSLSPFTSLIGDDNKGHTALLFFNLLGIFLVLKNLDTNFLRTLITTSLFSGICVAFIGIKELYFPTFGYSHLADRALGSFGHPNYLAGYLLLLLPLTSYILSKASFSKGSSPKGGWIKTGVTLLFLTTILLSKSIVAIVLALGYLFYVSTQSQTLSGILTLFKSKGYMLSPLFWKRGALGGIIVGGVILLTLITLYLPEKLHSFLSRFYIWETTLGAITSNWKIFLFGGGAETLSYIFDIFKSPEVYIYENFGFTADRPHNFFLDIFYHFGVLGVSVLLFLIYKFIFILKNQMHPLSPPKDKGEKEHSDYLEVKAEQKEFKIKGVCIVIIIFLLFGIIHFFSIASYLIVVLCIVLISRNISQTQLIQLSLYKRNEATHKKMQFSLSWQETRGIAKQERVAWARIKRGILGGLLVLLSLTGAYYSLQFYRAELQYTQRNYSEAQSIFSHPRYLIALGEYKEAEKLEGILSVKNIKTQIKNSEEQETLCNILLEKYSSAENYFYCGEIFETLGNTKLSLTYYKTGLGYLPDLWNENSEYWDNYFIKKTITGNRFFSEKFGDIGGILEKVGK